MFTQSTGQAYALRPYATRKSAVSGVASALKEQVEGTVKPSFVTGYTNVHDAARSITPRDMSPDLNPDFPTLTKLSFPDYLSKRLVGVDLGTGKEFCRKISELASENDIELEMHGTGFYMSNQTFLSNQGSDSMDIVFTTYSEPNTSHSIREMLVPADELLRDNGFIYWRCEKEVNFAAVWYLLSKGYYVSWIPNDFASKDRIFSDHSCFGTVIATRKNFAVLEYMSSLGIAVVHVEDKLERLRSWFMPWKKETFFKLEMLCKMFRMEPEEIEPLLSVLIDEGVVQRSRMGGAYWYSHPEGRTEYRLLQGRATGLFDFLDREPPDNDHLPPKSSPAGDKRESEDVIEISRVDSADWDEVPQEIIDIAKESFEEYDEDMLQDFDKRIKNPKCVSFVARVNGELVGYITGSPITDHPDLVKELFPEKHSYLGFPKDQKESIFYVESMAILPEYRDKKIGAQLIRKIIEATDEQPKIDRIALQTPTASILKLLDHFDVTTYSTTTHTDLYVITKEDMRDPKKRRLIADYRRKLKPYTRYGFNHLSRDEKEMIETFGVDIFLRWAQEGDEFEKDLRFIINALSRISKKIDSIDTFIEYGDVVKDIASRQGGAQIIIPLPGYNDMFGLLRPVMDSPRSLKLIADALIKLYEKYESNHLLQDTILYFSLRPDYYKAIGPDVVSNIIERCGVFAPQVMIDIRAKWERAQNDPKEDVEENVRIAAERCESIEIELKKQDNAPSLVNFMLFVTNSHIFFWGGEEGEIERLVKQIPEIVKFLNLAKKNLFSRVSMKKMIMSLALDLNLYVSSPKDIGDLIVLAERGIPFYRELTEGYLKSRDRPKYLAQFMVKVEEAKRAIDEQGFFSLFDIEEVYAIYFWLKEQGVVIEFYELYSRAHSVWPGVYPNEGSEKYIPTVDFFKAPEDLPVFLFSDDQDEGYDTSSVDLEVAENFIESIKRGSSGLFDKNVFAQRIMACGNAGRFLRKLLLIAEPDMDYSDIRQMSYDEVLGAVMDRLAKETPADYLRSLYILSVEKYQSDPNFYKDMIMDILFAYGLHDGVLMGEFEAGEPEDMLFALSQVIDERPNDLVMGTGRQIPKEVRELIDKRCADIKAQIAKVKPVLIPGTVSYQLVPISPFLAAFRGEVGKDCSCGNDHKSSLMRVYNPDQRFYFLYKNKKPIGYIGLGYAQNESGERYLTIDTLQPVPPRIIRRVLKLLQDYALENGFKGICLPDNSTVMINENPESIISLAFNYGTFVLPHILNMPEYKNGARIDLRPVHEDLWREMDEEIGADLSSSMHYGKFVLLDPIASVSASKASPAGNGADVDEAAGMKKALGLRVKSQTANKEGDYGASIEALKAALEIHLEFDRVTHAAEDARHLGINYFRIKEYEPSADYFQRSAMFFDQSSDKEDISVSRKKYFKKQASHMWAQAANAYSQLSKTEEDAWEGAAWCLLNCIRFNNELAEKNMESKSRTILGNVYMEMEQFYEAAEQFTISAAIDESERNFVSAAKGHSQAAVAFEHQAVTIKDMGKKRSKYTRAGQENERSAKLNRDKVGNLDMALRHYLYAVIDFEKANKPKAVKRCKQEAEKIVQSLIDKAVSGMSESITPREVRTRILQRQLGHTYPAVIDEIRAMLEAQLGLLAEMHHQSRPVGLQVQEKWKAEDAILGAA